MKYITGVSVSLGFVARSAVAAFWSGALCSAAAVCLFLALFQNLLGPFLIVRIQDKDMLLSSIQALDQQEDSNQDSDQDYCDPNVQRAAQKAKLKLIPY